MKIISSKEFESSVYPTYSLISKNVETLDGSMLFPSNSFDCMRILYSEPVISEEKPDTLMKILATISAEIGDMFLHLSFPIDEEKFSSEKVLRHFLLTIDEVRSSSIDVLASKAEDLYRKTTTKECCFYPETLIYSPQGLWAIYMTIDRFGWLCMNKKFSVCLSNKYPEINREFEEQLFNCIKWYNNLPCEWHYEIGDDKKICSGWLREITTYMCRKDTNLDKDIDIIEAYRAMLHQNNT